ncbi:uncharacterized protein I303_105113 [Kwoniella dejecticola CBS 10117]|uniref:Uncharacterized protein n=1 Tax=Kwoniella dejecticola CBS 10117 TaxID=1296121 RepID=A0A1A6A3E1_9TREE|nr:uncharacterized protein I303_05442 [Kwoniella dejecticola CBS 10117]OBR84583.1 hypothetical protein I303_05442 [Kwoniella dejecticola CBS 10117]
MSANREINVTLYEIKRVENGRPVCDPRPFKSTIRMNEKLETLFNKWQKEREPETPLKEFEFLLYQRRHDEPDTGMTSGGGQQPNKGAIRLRGDQTPEQVHMQDNARIYVKRENLQCDVEEEPQVAA